MDWLREKNISFKLANLEAKEDFTIWKAWDKRNEVIKDSAGNEMKFPIRSGQLVDSEGNIQEFDKVKYLKKDVFERLFPNFSRNTRFIREIIINDTHYNYGFTQSANNKLKELIATLIITKVDPLTMTFKQTYNASAAPVNKYNVYLEGAPTSAPTTPAQPSVPGLTSGEKEIVDAIKSKFTDKIDETRFVEIMKSNGVSPVRAKELFKQY